MSADDKPARLFAEFTYQTKKSWARARRVVAKAECLDKGENPRNVGLTLAMITRILLLLSLTWIMRLTTPMFAIAGYGFSGCDLILLLGGVFLLWKSVHEVHQHLEGEAGVGRKARERTGMAEVLVQIGEDHRGFQRAGRDRQLKPFPSDLAGSRCAKAPICCAPISHPPIRSRSGGVTSS